MWDTIDSLSGVAALLNGLLLWPIVRSLKTVTTSHASRLTKLEARPRKKRSKR